MQSNPLLTMKSYLPSSSSLKETICDEISGLRHSNAEAQYFLRLCARYARHHSHTAAVSMGNRHNNTRSCPYFRR